MDHFKSINDELGHEAGDEALVYISFRLQDFFRAVDCVSRLGGDEFAVVLPDCGAADAAKLAERLMSELSRPNPERPLPQKLQDRIGFSVGISCLPDHTQDTEELMRLADEALYESKRSGRNKFKVYQAKSN
jgi:diguanylate cyclase (GGDEF)-like protein